MVKTIMLLVVTFSLYYAGHAEEHFVKKIPSGILSEQEAQRESPCHLLDKSKPLE